MYQTLVKSFCRGSLPLLKPKKPWVLFCQVSSSLFVTLLIVFSVDITRVVLLGWRRFFGILFFEQLFIFHIFFIFFHAGTVVGMVPVLLNSLLRAALSSSLLGRAGKIPWNLILMSGKCFYGEGRYPTNLINQNQFHLFLASELHAIPEAFAVPVVLKFHLAIPLVEGCENFMYLLQVHEIWIM